MSDIQMWSENLIAGMIHVLDCLSSKAVVSCFTSVVHTIENPFHNKKIHTKFLNGSFFVF